MKKKADLLHRYQAYIDYAVEDYMRHGSSDTNHQYSRGVAAGVGFALGYKLDRIESDIDAAIAAAKATALTAALAEVERREAI